ncbi:MAG: hypothetical protein ACOYMD_16275, partial [Paludibacter sp.]
FPLTLNCMFFGSIFFSALLRVRALLIEKASIVFSGIFVGLYEKTQSVWSLNDFNTNLSDI